MQIICKSKNREHVDLIMTGHLCTQHLYDLKPLEKVYLGKPRENATMTFFFKNFLRLIFESLFNATFKEIPY